MSASTRAMAYLVGLFLVVVMSWSLWHPEGREAQEQRRVVRSAGFRVDLQGADAATLELLPGVGPGIAGHIIDAREGGVVFAGPDDLEGVKYVGPSVIRRVGPWVSYGGVVGD
jgi:DNA uptake protein ComE-like DNA-binding protein